MRVVIQRVSRASVEVDGACVGSIARGLLVLLGVGKEDTEKDAEYLSAKLTQLRIFPDEAGKMNRSLVDVGGEVLIVSQFTLFGDCSKGRRPSFERAALPQEAKRLYEYFVQKVMATGLTVATGIFQAEMTVSLVNEGPVTLILDSKSLIGK